MHIYLKNNPAKFHPDPIWNNGVFVRSPPQQEEEQQQQQQQDE